MALGDDTEALQDVEAVDFMVTRWELRNNVISSRFRPEAGLARSRYQCRESPLQ